MNVLILFHFLLICSSLISPKKKINKRKNIINISFAINNNYSKLLLIPLISLLKNSNKNSIYYIHIMVGQEFEHRNYQLLCNLEKIYLNCFIHIINLGNDFDYVYKSFLDKSAYYRLELPDLCPNINRIIYVDTDTIILKDLMELYSLNFKGNYILAKLDIYPKELDNFNIYVKNYINSGVLLMDLYSLRKYGYVEKFINYTKVHNNKLYLNAHDQTVINYICHEKIGILKPIYHMWAFNDPKGFIEEHSKTRTSYNPIDVVKGYYDPFIVHFPGNMKYTESNKNENHYYRMYDKYLNESKEIINKLNQY